MKVGGHFFSCSFGSLSLAVWLTMLAAATCFGQGDEQAPTSQDALVDLLNPDTAQTAMNLETGLALQTVMSPLHWGHVSLLSASVYEGYDSNTELQKVPLGSSLTSLNALAVYSVERRRTELDLQYHPFLWLSQKQTVKDIGSASADLHTEHPISEHWFWNIGDSFHYSPNQENTIEGSSFSADFGQGITVGSPFLSTGWNMLGNALTFGVDDRYTQWSSVRFHASGDYIRLSQFIGTSFFSLSERVILPTQELLSYGFGGIWTNRLNYRDTLDLRYDYRSQTSIDTSLGNGQSHFATFTWAHLFTDSFRLRAGAGPGWMIADTSGIKNSTHRVLPTLQGSVELFKQFQKGGIAVSFARSDQFSGVIGNGFYNRYDLSVDRRLSLRWNVNAIGSYLQQGILSRATATGEQGSVEIDRFLTRNWSVFAQGRYLSLANVGPAFAPQKIATLGLRWEWVPDKP
jgi:hypothetical protein